MMVGNKITYGLITVGVGILINILLSGVEGLEKEEKICTIIWSILLLFVLSMKYYKG